MAKMQTPIPSNNTIFRTWILVVLWVFQMIVELVVIGLYGLALAGFSYIKSHDNNGSYCINSWSTSYTSSSGWSSDDYSSCTSIADSALNAGIAASAVAVTIAILFFISHIVQQVLYGRRCLTPARHFGFELTRWIFWTILLILAIVAVIMGSTTIASVVVVVIVWVLYLLSMIYASILFHRYRKGHYNTLPTSYAGTEPYQFSYKQETGYNGGVNQPQLYDQTPYHAAYQQPGPVPSVPRFQHA